MGNAQNFCGDNKVMKDLHVNQVDFFSDRALFNVQDIKFPLSTEAIKIVDASKKRVKLAGGNWSGAHMCRHTVDGLECRPLRDIAMDIRYKFKMNCIRLTYSLQMYFQDKPIPEKYLTANPDLKGKTGMEIFDITIKVLTEVGLMVILNNHTSTSQWCCSNDDGDGLWWSRQFPQHMFFQCAQHFAKRYGDNPRVIGMDLRNQLRKAHGLTPTWGDGNHLTDWRRAAKICSDKVQAIAPHWLIFISGLDYQLDLTFVKDHPIVLNVPNKLVYTGHFYGFSWVSPQITSWNLVSYEGFKQKFFNSQTFVRAIGFPYFLGQFGNNQRDIPWNYLMKYLKQTDIDWTYWALDGFKCQPKEDQTYGVFTNDFATARHPDMLKDMIEVGPPPGTIIQPPQQSQNNLQPQLYQQHGNTQPSLYQQPRQVHTQQHHQQQPYQVHVQEQPHQVHVQEHYQQQPRIYQANQVDQHHGYEQHNSYPSQPQPILQSSNQFQRNTYQPHPQSRMMSQSKKINLVHNQRMDNRSRSPLPPPPGQPVHQYPNYSMPVNNSYMKPTGNVGNVPIPHSDFYQMNGSKFDPQRQ